MFNEKHNIVIERYVRFRFASLRLASLAYVGVSSRGKTGKRSTTNSMYLLGDLHRENSVWPRSIGSEGPTAEYEVKGHSAPCYAQRNFITGSNTSGDFSSSAEVQTRLLETQKEPKHVERRKVGRKGRKVGR